MEQDPEFLLLHSINDLSKQQTGISQRDLARAINLSLGMTNALVKRLSQKGLIMMQKVSARSMSYVLTPEGLNELARRTYRYLKGTMRKGVDYKEAIVSIAEDAAKRGVVRLALLGRSDLDFIIEYAAHRAGLEYLALESADDVPKDSFVFVSEEFAEAVPGDGESVARIRELLSGVR